MLTITLEAPFQLVRHETEAPAPPGNGEALVRIHRVGICGTDLHAFRGRQPFFSYPRILGHELGVEVVALGEGAENLRVGDHCALEPYLHCGICIACRRGKTNCCARLQVLGVHIDGGMRELIHVPAAKLHVSPSLSLEALALVETLGIGAHAVSRAQIEPGEFALVIGAGPIGLSVMQFAQEAGAQTIVLDVNTMRLEFCQQRLGITHTLLSGENTIERLRDLTGGDLPTLVFDATGNSTSMQEAFAYVAPGGRLVFVGLVLGEITFSDPDFHRKEMTLLATRNATGNDFKRIIGLMESGKIDTSPWITHRADAGELVDHFASWLAPEAGVIKAMVSF